MTSRREFLQGAAASAAFLAAPAAALAQEQSSPAIFVPKNAGKPKRVIFLVSDGMSTGVPSLAEHFSLAVRKKPTRFAQLLSDKKASKGFFETHSLDSMVTDSSAAATAWGSGSRIFNRSVNVLPNGTALTPIHPLVKASGYGTGLVTTARVTHATPAGFAASVEHRDDEHLIGPQYLGVVDVILGGGTEVYAKDKRSDREDLFAAHAAKGYGVALDRDAMLAASPDKPLLGIFGERGHLPYTLDQMHDAELARTIPTLAEMTAKALAILEKNPNGFLLQVEGARVDHAAHANDAAGILWDQLAFDDAIEVALQFREKYPDTLIVVTSDHGNSNPGLNGMGSGYTDSTKCFERLAMAKGSVDAIERAFRYAPADYMDPNAPEAESEKPTVSPEKSAEIVKEATGLEISLDDATMLAEAAARKPVPEINSLHRRFVGILGQVLGNHTGIGWTGTTHTEDFTVIAALGPGQEAFGGLVKNTDAFPFFCDCFGVSQKNPAMTIEEAAKFASAPSRRVGDWA